MRISAGRVWISRGSLRELGLPPDAAALGRLIDAVVSPSAKLVRTFKEDTRSVVRQVEVDDRTWVVKRYLGSPWKTGGYHLARRTPAWREWHNGRILGRAGIRVVEPLALVHEAKFGRWGQCLITPYLGGPSLHRWIKQSPALASLDPHQRRRRLAMARAVGRQVGRISAAGYMNRDHKASNVIIDAACERGGEPILIDPACIKRRRSDDQVYLMLAMLVRSVRRAGPTTELERAAVLRGLIEAGGLCGNGRRRLHTAAAGVERIDQQWANRSGSATR